MSSSRLSKGTTDVDEGDSNAGFLRAARDGNLDEVVHYIRSGIDINTSNPNGLNALHLATKEGHFRIVTELIRREANVEAATKKGNTALHIASLAGHDDIVKKLVESGAQVNLQAQAGFTPLYMASQEGHADVVKYLLANGANQGLSTEDGFTPLAVALQQGHDKVVTVLLEHDTKGKVRLPALHIAAKKDDVKSAALLLQNEQNSVELQTKSGFTPLHIASHYGNINVANLLIQRNADVNMRAKNNITPLHVASRWGKLNMVNLLVDNNANIDEKTRDGLTPLHCAARSGHDSVVDTLLERGAPNSAKTKNGLTPLHMAAQGDHEDCARLLLYHKALINEVTVDYLTPLHVAAHCGNVKTAKLMLDRKCEPNARALNGFTPLHIACKKNRIKVVELLLKYGASIESKTESGLTPLHVASFMGHMNIVIYLIQHNANPNTTTVRGETSLHLAARANQSDIIRILLRNGATVDARAREQQTPLHIAARLGNVDNVVLLLQHGAVVDAATKDKYTPLHIAAKEGHDEVAQVLLEQEAQHDVTTKKGFTPLHIAAKYGNIKVAQLLLQKDANPNIQGKNGLTPLHVATHYNHTNVAQLLLENKADPHATAKNGYTPLHIAAKKNQMDIATMLLEYGAKPDSESKNGFTPLHLASQEGHTDIVSLLLEKDADVNCKAHNGLTPMHLAAQEDRVPVAEILCKYGSEIDTSTKAGYTPLHTACHFGQVNMVRFLLGHEASVNATTKVGYTPLHQAAQQGHVQVVGLLLKNQASPNAVTNNGQTPLAIAQKLGYISVVEILKPVTDVQGITPATEDKYKVVSPETMQETFISDSEDEGDDKRSSYISRDDSLSLERGGSTSPLDISFDKDVHLRHPATDHKGRQVSQMGATMHYPSYLENGPDYEEEMRYYHGDTLSPKDKNSSPDKSRTDSVFYSGDYSTLGSNRDSLTLDWSRERSTGGSTAEIFGGDEDDLKYGQDDAYSRKSDQISTEDLFARQSFHNGNDAPELTSPNTWSGQESSEGWDSANITFPAQTSAARGREIGPEREVTASVSSKDFVSTPEGWDSANITFPAQTSAARGKEIRPEREVTASVSSTPPVIMRQGPEEYQSPTVKKQTPSDYWDTEHASYQPDSPESPIIAQKNYTEDWDNVDAARQVETERHPEHIEAVNVSYQLKSSAPPTIENPAYQQDHDAVDSSDEMESQDTPTETEKNPEFYDAVHASYQVKSPASPTIKEPIYQHDHDDVDDSYEIRSPDSPIETEKNPEFYDAVHASYQLKSPASPTLKEPIYQHDHGSMDASSEIKSPDSPTEKSRELYDAAHVSYQLKSPASPTVKGPSYQQDPDDLHASYMIKSPDSPTTVEKVSPNDWDTADISYEDRSFISPIETEQSSPGQWDIPKIVYQGQYSPSTTDQNSDCVTFLPDDSVQPEFARELDKEKEYMDAQITSQSFQTMNNAGPPSNGRLPVVTDTHRYSSYSGSSFSTSFDPDNVPVDRSPVYSGFLISFMVDARGGAMRGCRHPGVRIIIPPRKCCMPTRITCRLVKKEKLVKPPPMLEGEGLAARVLEMGPVSTKFLGPVLLEVPHFASLRGKEREVIILRSDNGETWYEHPMLATEDAVTEALGNSVEGGIHGSQPSVSSLWQLDSEENLSKKRIKRILTTDLPQYFALVTRVTRVKQESIVIGMEGGVLSSNVVPQVQAVLPEGTLTRPIPVGLQAQPIAPELVAKLLGNRVAVSPIVTIEPRRRKFHKPITLTIPVPRAAQKGMINQYGGDRPTLRLLFSLAADPNPALWEDVTDSKPMTLVDDCVSFTTTVSARFWLIDCQNVAEAPQIASILYQEAVTVPYMAKFVVFAKRDSTEEGKLRIFCMTDDKDDKTLEKQERFFEVARSRDIEVLEGRPQFVEMAGNLIPVTKSGDQLHVNFRAFRENRLPCTVKVRDQEQEASARVAFMKEPKVARGEAPQTPICNLNIRLPDLVPLDTSDIDTDKAAEILKRHDFLRGQGLVIQDSVHSAEMKLSDVADALQGDWVALAQQLHISISDINHIKNEYKTPGDQALAMLHLWVQRNPNRATDNQLETALRRINRDDIVRKCVYNVERVDDELEAAAARVAMDQSGFETLREELGVMRDSLHRDQSLDVQYDEQDIIKESESAGEDSPSSKRGRAVYEIRDRDLGSSVDEEPVLTTENIARAATRFASASDDQYNSGDRDAPGVQHGTEREVKYSRAEIVSQQVLHSSHVTSESSSQIVSPVSEAGHSYADEPASVPEPSLPEGFRADELAFEKVDQDDDDFEDVKSKFEDTRDDSYYLHRSSKVGDLSSDADTFRTADQSLETRLNDSRYSDVDGSRYYDTRPLDDDGNLQEQTLRAGQEYLDSTTEEYTSDYRDDERGFPGEEGYPAGTELTVKGYHSGQGVDRVVYRYQGDERFSAEDTYQPLDDHYETDKVHAGRVGDLSRAQPGDAVYTQLSENVGSPVDSLGSPVDATDHSNEVHSGTHRVTETSHFERAHTRGSQSVSTVITHVTSKSDQLTAEHEDESFLDRREETAVLPEKYVLSDDDIPDRRRGIMGVSHTSSGSLVDTTLVVDESALDDDSHEGRRFYPDTDHDRIRLTQVGSSVDMAADSKEAPLLEKVEVDEHAEILSDGTHYHTRRVRSHSFQKVDQRVTQEGGVQSRIEEQTTVPKLEREDVVETYYEPPRMVRETKNVEQVLEDGVRVQRKVVYSRVVHSTRTHQESYDTSLGRQTEDFEISEIVPGTVSAFMEGSDSSDSDYTDDEYVESHDVIDHEETADDLRDGSVATTRLVTSDVNRRFQDRSESDPEHVGRGEASLTPVSQSDVHEESSDVREQNPIRISRSVYEEKTSRHGAAERSFGSVDDVYSRQGDVSISSDRRDSADVLTLSLDTEDELIGLQGWRQAGEVSYRHAARANYSSDDLNTSGAESYSSVHSDDDVQSHRIIMKKDIHKRTLIGRSGQDETSVFEDSQVQQDNEPPEELRESMQEIINQFMEMPPHPIQFSKDASRDASKDSIEDEV